MNKKPHIYKVGIYRDFDKLRNKGFKVFWYWFIRSYGRKSYWNGYLAESEDKHRCGKGWTKRQAYNNWRKIISS